MTRKAAVTLNRLRSDVPWRLRSVLPRRLRDDNGNAILEFVVLGVALLVPCLYLVLSLGAVQSAAFAADVMVRDAARIHATERDPARARARADEHLRLVREDFRLGGREKLSILCSKTPCASPGGTVTARVRITVPIPGLGPALGSSGPIAIGAQHTIEVGEHRGMNR